MQPRCQRPTSPNRRRLSREDEKNRLAGVFGVSRIPQSMTADAQDHAAVALNEGGESHLVSKADKALEQLLVGSGLRLVSSENGS
jgi:hypothetical protein